MSLRLPPSDPLEATEDLSSASESSEDDNGDEQNWDDFAEDTVAQQTCFSLFEDKKFPSVTETLAYDRSNHGFDLDQTCSRLGTFLHSLTDPQTNLRGIALDFHQRIRLINYIRKNVCIKTSSEARLLILSAVEIIHSGYRILHRRRKFLIFG